MKRKVMEVITYKKQTSKTKYVIEATIEYRLPLNISRKFFSIFYSRKYDSFFLLNFGKLVSKNLRNYLKKNCLK